MISGVAIDARWASCRISGGTGAIKYNIYKGRGNVTLGTDFRASTCLKVHYRGYNSTGNFSSTQKWNWSWA